MSADSERSTATPSTDLINLQANAWMPPDVLARLKEIANPVSTPAISPTGKIVQAAHVQALAARLGKDAEEMASRIPEDTLRRLKNPVIAVQNEDGTTTYRDPTRIVQGDAAMIPNLHSDRGTDGVVQPGRTRDESGKFTK